MKKSHIIQIVKSLVSVKDFQIELEFFALALAYAFIIIAIGYLLTGCGLVRPQPKPAPDTDYCDAAGYQIEKLGCRDRRGDPMWVNKHGERFGETCRKIQKASGIFLNPKCISEAKNCNEVMACPMTQSGGRELE